MKNDGMTIMEQHNYKMLFLYNIYNGLGITLVCSLLINDMLCLRMDFDLAKFGIIKSSIFLLPALSYIFLVPLFRRLDRDIAVCAWSYLLRIMLPIVMPVAAIFCGNKDVLLWLMVIVTSIAFSAAMVANNTLLKMMRNTMPPAQLTRRSAMLVIMPSILTTLAGVPCVWLLSRVDETSNAKFYVLLAGLELLAACFEWPAIRALWKVRLNRDASCVSNGKSQGALASLCNVKCVALMAYSLIRGVWTGMLATYFVVYLLKCGNVPASVIQPIEFGLCLLTLLLVPYLGKVADKLGFAKSLTALAAVIGVSGLLWTLCPNRLVVLILFILVVYNGNNGIAPSLVLHIERVALMMQAPERFSEFFIGVNSLFASIGSFAGCILAGKVYAMLAGTEAQRLRKFFDCCNAFPIAMLLLGLLLILQERRSRRRSSQGA